MEEKTLKKYVVTLSFLLAAGAPGAAFADPMGTPHPSASPSHMMNHGSSMMSHGKMKASPKPSPHGNSMMSHGSMMKASPKPTPRM
jgi:hypothetical protein